MFLSGGAFTRVSALDPLILHQLSSYSKQLASINFRSWSHRGPSLQSGHSIRDYSSGAPTPTNSSRGSAKNSVTADCAEELAPARPGTAPELSTYLVLHTSTPSTQWPSHPPMMSPLMKALLMHMKPYKGIVNISRDRSTIFSHAFPPPNPSTLEAYPATLYRSGNRAGIRPPPIPISSLSLENIGVLDQYLREAVDSTAKQLPKGELQFRKWCVSPVTTTLTIRTS